VGKFDLYKIPLKTISEGLHTFDYELNDVFFEKIDSPEVRKGTVKVVVTLKKTADIFELNFNLTGIVYIPCDRCLDDMEQPVSYKGKLYVRFGNDFSQESDELVIIPENEGEINIAWFLYEFIVLSIPSKHVHAPGKCNKMMSSKLRKHLITSDEEDDDDDFDSDEESDDEVEIDPRWSKLKDIIDNN
jgi:uncharacterized metal-binding protein YceD (DUF177 family)